MFEILGVAGIAISVWAYVPQVIHLWREHCSAGVSTSAWAMWLASGILIGILAIHRGDPVFILLQVSSLTSAALILLLARRYRGMSCETHVQPVHGRPPRLFVRQRRALTGRHHGTLATEVLVAEEERDESRLPPGQYVWEGFPVLPAGPTRLRPWSSLGRMDD